ncbi:probable 2-polyprenyl-6-methoxyphenol hydroxylase and related FAD-dependent oxidoreductases [Cephalotrichum gorgonifer]|uniref:Probable 2-polyprenyl-6-methoxyphenol hydroxylase and related FAD-dependent oxidoreductases n=1 Tax=Cephalotrichum gorgonifer TaxID=2041049 RepID=A0AAE8SY82_9PEZI|nr:probable 2-polyprenyl-6-methoxyphenol hydroxylase and related FAD-dependent oxidoreductases [Cephalotrichum gorgonifer]
MRANDMNGTSKSTPGLGSKFGRVPLVPSYPTGSLDFLHALHNGKEQHEGIAPSAVTLDVMIVGAGLGGLSTAIALARKGHRVRVFEQAAKLGEVGAGIQIPSNSTRLLIKWGLEPLLAPRVVEPTNIRFRRWENGDVIGNTRLVPHFRENFGAPYYVIHRAHFHDVLHQQALSLGVEVVINSKVRSYDASKPSITLADGQAYEADLVIAADGIMSAARAVIHDGEEHKPLRTGFAAYRAIVEVDKMRQDPDTAWLLENPGLNIWIGDGRHVMTYSISGGNSFNMVLSHPSTSDPATWKQETALGDMKAEFSGWDKTLTKLINMIDSTMKWPLSTGSKIERWIHPSNKLLMLGDAAHAMVPYMSQGAAMAVEDAAALAEALDLIDHKDDVERALYLWQDVRMKRTSQMQEASLINGTLWHFADGPEQRARDLAMRQEVEGKSFVSSPNQWTDPTTQRWCYGYDAEQEVRAAWEIRAETV